VVEGAASQSYGIEVARLAGLPTAIIARARNILAHLESGEIAGRLTPDTGPDGAAQMTLFAPAESRALAELKTVDIDRLTPVDALNLLARIAHRLRQGGG
jgi:DNA mismatch repair protein MutS